MYRANVTKRKDSFVPNCVSKNGTRREIALKAVEKRLEMQERSCGRENVRRVSDASVVEFDEEAWVDKSRKIAFAGRKLQIYAKCAIGNSFRCKYKADCQNDAICCLF